MKKKKDPIYDYVETRSRKETTKHLKEGWELVNQYGYDSWLLGVTYRGLPRRTRDTQNTQKGMCKLANHWPSVSLAENGKACGVH